MAKDQDLLKKNSKEDIGEAATTAGSLDSLEITIKDKDSTPSR